MNFSNALSLADRTAFVTGAGAGLGRSVARLMAAAGACVVCADIDADAAEATAAEIRATGATAHSQGLDVTDREAVRAAVRAACARTGRLDAMCNIAGVPGDGQQVADLDEASFDRVFAVNFKGVLFGSQAALECMTGAKRGAIVNMASSAIDLAFPGSASYSVAKSAVVMFTKTLATEAGPLGIRANVVAPGFVPTRLSMLRNDDDDATRQAYLAAWAQRAPLQRVGDADDIAHQFLYLASDAASFVTGQILRANGGATMPW
ncbi:MULTISPECIES: SDR family NAD(P)-dependent oxidoreductase [unclassified Variovorax]|jgi:NAD(P)-dependent dehydrogenase (short-subunit alcohol dehydrogenase family)|uniref:SDR family NAD(P)-dependent oxidoreductase n=1 Tax=unclassified Variovorax TaxID=663243 RepID=UPI0021BB6217|nr:glucose 1-dehydrogenase [Variovorax sp. CY25R-8]MCT8173990.1 glucose 1-dehydrogenase [Variovorax sp. CY25R-8]